VRIYTINGNPTINHPQQPINSPPNIQPTAIQQTLSSGEDIYNQLQSNHQSSAAINQQPSEHPTNCHPTNPIIG